MKFQALAFASVFFFLPAFLFGQKVNPTPMDTYAPGYPEALIESGKDGSATITFEITRKGLVVDPFVSEASEPEFGEAALVAIKNWRFRPATVDGDPVSRKVTLPFKFTASPMNKLNAYHGRKVFMLIDAKLYKARDLDERPTVVKKTRALYPAELADSDLDERVSVHVVIGPDGKVYNPEIFEIENQAFMIPALIAAAGYEFEPPMRKTQPVYCAFEMTIWVYQGEKPPGR